MNAKWEKLHLRQIKAGQIKNLTNWSNYSMLEQHKQQRNRCKLSNHDTHPAEFLALDGYEAHVPLTEEPKLFSLFIEAFPTYLMDNKKIKTRVLSWQPRESQIETFRIRAFAAQIHQLLCTHSTVQYSIQCSSSGLKRSYLLGMNQSCPEKKAEPGHNKTTMADTVQVLEESCCSG